jgi:tetratricopeptide (TPR) repeat protein/tRNA A-37 threonylcarbamoyl transferase component Bud32
MDRTGANEVPRPEQISRFKILESLGEGAMGVVYRARDTLLKRDVALKLIQPRLSEDPRSRSRFVREAQAAAAINHPGIATIYEAGEADEGWLYLATELIDGETLKDRVARGPIPPREVVELGVQLAEALAAAHRVGTIHRDIKPGNLMISDEGRLKILDFGLARLAMGPDPSDRDDEQTMTQTREGMVLGTPAYMSPEQAAGMKVDGRTDIFASGCVMYEMISGVSPFKSGSVPETLRRILVEEPPELESSTGAIPAGLEAVLRKALAKDREQRYATAVELARDLRELRRAESVIPTSEQRRRRRRAALARALFGAALVTLGVLGVLQLPWWNRTTLAFEHRDRLLIAEVENRTDEEAFDLALRTALEADLQQSPHALVVQQGQVRETLQLMRRDPSTPVDEQLGRDICRFGGIRAMLLPRILSVGEAYELQAVLVDPVTGNHVGQFRVTARGREEVLLEAIDELALQVRKRLGESLESIEESDARVARVTTSSWEALRYLSLANVKWGLGEFREAASLLELAIENDPHFASAKGSLGLLLIQFLDDEERGKALLREALEDGAELPRREYLMIRAVNRHFVDGDLEAALAEYEVISEIFPEHMPAYNNRGRILIALRRFDQAVEMFEQAAELDQHSPVPLINLYFLHVMRLANAPAAESAARRMVEMGPEVPGFRTFLGWSLAAQARFDEAIPELRSALELEPDNQYALPNLAQCLYATGAFEESARLFRRNLELIEAGHIPGNRSAETRDLALALMASEDVLGAETVVGEEIARLRSSPTLTPTDHLRIGYLAAAVDRDEEAESSVLAARTVVIESPHDLMDLAVANALMGRDDEALALVEKSLEAGYDDPFLPLVIAPFQSLRESPRFLALFGIDEGTGGRNKADGGT